MTVFIIASLFVAGAIAVGDGEDGLALLLVAVGTVVGLL